MTESHRSGVTGWRIEVRHRTGYRYSTPVRASYNEARVTPPSRDGQLALDTRLEITPSVRPLRYRDYWDTIVDAFDVHVPHTELTVTSIALVETSVAPPEPDAGWVAVADPAVRDRYDELLTASRYVVRQGQVGEIAASLRSDTPAETARRASAWVHGTLAYQKGSTGVHTTSAEALAEGKGVCQDFAHVTLSVLRAAGLPARYVSGYLHPDADAEIGLRRTGESHAWVEYWAGRWHPLDPTSGAAVGERHVAVARGRDYADVRPLSGIYHGPPAEALGVTVDVTRLR